MKLEIKILRTDGTLSAPVTISRCSSKNPRISVIRFIDKNHAGDCTIAAVIDAHCPKLFYVEYLGDKKHLAVQNYIQTVIYGVKK